MRDESLKVIGDTHSGAIIKLDPSVQPRDWIRTGVL
jgi:hypothetical protein